LRVEVSCLARVGRFASPCDRCGGDSSLVVRSLWRTAHAPLAAMRYHFCLRHRRDALLLQTELIAEAAARRYASPVGPAAVGFPFVLPDRFLARLGCMWREGLVALYWDAVSDRLGMEGRSRAFVSRFDAGLWLALVRKPAVALWLQEHMVCLGSRADEASHALLVDCASHRAIVARVADARRAVAARSAPRDRVPPTAGTTKGGN
jgi:hypothetical protein